MGSRLAWISRSENGLHHPKATWVIETTDLMFPSDHEDCCEPKSFVD